MPTFLQDPDARLDYYWNWAYSRGWVDGDTITTVDTTTPAGLVVENVAIVAGTDRAGNLVSGGGVVAWISGGTIGNAYPVTCHIVTAAGREDDETLTFRIVAT